MLFVSMQFETGKESVPLLSLLPNAIGNDVLPFSYGSFSSLVLPQSFFVFSFKKLNESAFSILSRFQGASNSNCTFLLHLIE